MNSILKSESRLEFDPRSLPAFRKWVCDNVDGVQDDEYLIVKYHVFSMGEENDAFVDSYAEAVKLFREFRNEHQDARIYIDSDIEGDTVYEDCIRSWDDENEYRYNRLTKQ